jgi:hypothetical protein
MKRVGIFASISVLSLAFASCTFACAQDQDDKHQDKQNHGQEKKQHDQGHDQYQPDQYKNHGQEKKQENEDKHAYKGDNGNHYGQIKQMERSEQQVREEQTAQRRAWQERRANHWDYEHRGWQQRGGYHGYRVPDDYFRGHYGNDHWFRVYSLPFAYEGGNPRFQYGGYWFTMMDPYPEYWGGTWYQNDDVYVDYQNDGYYLYNRRYPGRPGIAISISF